MALRLATAPLRSKGARACAGVIVCRVQPARLSFQRALRSKASAGNAWRTGWRQRVCMANVRRPAVSWSLAWPVALALGSWLSAGRAFARLLRQGTGAVRFARRAKLPAPAFTVSDQANRRISTGQLNALLRLHLRPIDVVVFHVPQGRPCFEGGFPLRCLQRLSCPDIATLHCGWRHNRSTSGPSTPVLSY